MVLRALRSFNERIDIRAVSRIFLRFWWNLLWGSHREKSSPHPTDPLTHLFLPVLETFLPLSVTVFAVEKEKANKSSKHPYSQVIIKQIEGRAFRRITDLRKYPEQQEYRRRFQGG